MASSNNEEEAFLKFLKKSLNKSMCDAAEPVIQEALKDIELKMRKDLAANLINFIDSSVQMERYGTDLRVIIKKAYER